MCKKVYCPVNVLKLTTQQKSFVHEGTAAVSTTYRSQWYSTINNLPHETWNAVSDEPNQYFDPVYMEALETTNRDHIDFHYLVLFKGMQPVAQAIVQVIDLEIPEISKEGAEPGFLSNLGSKIIDLARKKPLRLMVCGNIFVTGETSYRIKKGENQEAVLSAMSDAFHSLRKELDNDKKVQALLFKDYPNDAQVNAEKLKDYGFHSFQVEPNMVLDIHPDWRTFDDYLDSMVAKYRTKAHAAYKKSNRIVAKDMGGDDIERHLYEMNQLYNQVASKADFNLAYLDLRAYVKLKREKGDCFTVRGYWLDGKMVAFMTGLTYNGALDAHYVGFDYDLNRKYQLYSRILYDYVQVAIAMGAKQINFGRTSNEIKSTLGAEPVALTCYARHRNPLSNQFVKPIFRLIGPKDWDQRRPFKKEYYEKAEVH